MSVIAVSNQRPISNNTAAVTIGEIEVVPINLSVWSAQLSEYSSSMTKCYLSPQGR
jgi:hypothetical protein